MSALHIDQSKVTPEIADSLIKGCPFGAITYENGEIQIGSGCKMCKLCVKKSNGVITLEEENKTYDFSDWRGIAVYADINEDKLHDVSLELLSKAQELAKVTKHPIYAVAIGYNINKHVDTLLAHGADKVFVYDYPELEAFDCIKYTNALEDFINKVKPSSILVGATNTGRTLAPRAAARFRTGLTADCTVLEMKENTDLVQIRPAFGGNIMAQIITPRTRPQFCTVRYKIFKKSEPTTPHGEVVKMELPTSAFDSPVEVLSSEPKPKVIDISEADIIVAVGRGVKNKADIALAEELADLLGAQLACTRPMVENGMFDPRRQIGLSGRTVNAKLIITIGISGSVQFAAGMKGSDCIIAINSDPSASIFNIAHYGFVGDLYEVVPMLIEKIKNGAKLNV